MSLVAAGLPAEAIEAQLARLPAPPPADPVELAEDDEGGSVALFLAMGTQWRWVGGRMPFRTGLEYTAIAPTAAGLGVAVTPRTMLDLGEMEQAVLALDAERRARS